jgi:hypothetical protein
MAPDENPRLVWDLVWGDFLRTHDWCRIFCAARLYVHLAWTRAPDTA